VRVGSTFTLALVAEKCREQGGAGFIKGLGLWSVECGLGGEVRQGGAQRAGWGGCWVWSDGFVVNHSIPGCLADRVR